MQAIAILLAAAQPVPAAPDQVGFDIQCMLAAQSAAERVEGEAKAALMLSAMFYFGRIDSALSQAEYERRLELEGARIQGQQLAPLLKSCGDFMKGRATSLQEIGSRIQAKEKARGID